MRRGWRATGPIALVLLAAILGACGGTNGPTPVTTIAGSAIVAEIASFQLVANQPGRLLIALVTGDNRWLSFGSVAVEFSYLGDGHASPPPTSVTGPATADYLAIPGSPEAAGRPPTLTLPADGRGVYAAEPVVFSQAGFWQVTASGTLGDGSGFAASGAFSVVDRPTVPVPGALAPRTENAIIGSPGVASSAIDSRAIGGAAIPDAELHQTSIAQAIARGHPALVVFSTPVYCVSRFCGPVTDLVADLASRYADRADFIHVEIYQDFEKGLVNQAALDWLKTGDGDVREPWTFLIGSDGRIAGSWDTVVTRGEIEPLLEALPSISGRSAPPAARP
jgi:hypothetical protein